MLLRSLLAFAGVLFGLSGAGAQTTKLVYEQAFDSPGALPAFRATDPAAWRLDRGSLWQCAPSHYEPAFRSPLNLAILSTQRLGAFQLEADCMQTGREYGHRDLCIVFAFQDPDHYCYAHLSSTADENAHNVFVVDGAARTPITTRRTEGVDWGHDAWRRLRLEFDPHAGAVRVLLDGQEALFSDRVSSKSGYIGFGSFDDEGRFDNIHIWSDEAEERPCENFAPLPAVDGSRPIRLEPLDGRVRVTVGDELFTEYVYNDVRHAYLAPIMGPGGVRMTRAYPLEVVPGEAHDHPHHTGLWWAHGDINGADIWQGDAKMVLLDGPHLVNNQLVASYAIERPSGPTGVTVVEAISFAETLSGDRLIDVRIGLSPPPGGQLVLGDTKEGTMAIRTHPALRLEPSPSEGVVHVTGHAQNSEGVEGKAVWGKRAAWVDYWGSIDEATEGVAIFDHPSNPRFPTWWHAREYGLIAANPFGRSSFEGDHDDRGRMVVPADRNLSFQYRFVFHRFGTDEARVGDAYAEWSDLGPGNDCTAHEAVRLNDDGGWCWFEGERALVIGDTLAVGSVAAGAEDADRKGDIELTLWNLATGDRRTLELADRFQVDDHDQPGLCTLADGRLLALWSRHGPENAFSRAVIDPASGAIERGEPVVPTPASRVTYSNVYRLSAEKGRLYSFFRGLDNTWKPSYMTSDDGGATWHAGNVVIDVPTAQKHRPYVRYAGNDTDQIHLLYTEGHPRNFDNSVYHVAYSGGQLRTSNGTPIAPLVTGLASPEEGTLVFKGDPDHVAWVTDLRLDGAGKPVAVFSVQVGSAGLPVGEGGDDHRYHYARWDGDAWRVHQMAYAGSRLYPREDDYTGLAAIDPTDTSVVFISTNADPATGAPLQSRADGNRHWELFKGTTPDGGATWRWDPITRDSSVDNLRPVVAAGADGRRVLLWLRGRYRSYTDFDQDVMAMVNP